MRTIWTITALIAVLGLAAGGCSDDQTSDDVLDGTQAELRINNTMTDAPACDYDGWEVTVSACADDDVDGNPDVDEEGNPVQGELIDSVFVSIQEGVLDSNTSVDGLFPGGDASHFSFGDELIFGLTPDTCYYFTATPVVENADGSYSPAPRTFPGSDFTWGILEGTTETNLITTICDTEQLAAKDIVIVMANTPLITDVNMPDTKPCGTCEEFEICVTVSQLDWDDTYVSIDVWEYDRLGGPDRFVGTSKEILVPMNEDMSGYLEVCSTFSVDRPSDYYAEISSWTKIMRREDVAAELFTLDFYSNSCPLSHVEQCFDDSQVAAVGEVKAETAVSLESNYGLGLSLDPVYPNAVVAEISTLESSSASINLYNMGEAAIVSFDVESAYAVTSTTYFNVIASAQVVSKDNTGELNDTRAIGVIAAADLTGHALEIPYAQAATREATGREEVPGDDIPGGFIPLQVIKAPMLAIGRMNATDSFEVVDGVNYDISYGQLWPGSEWTPDNPMWQLRWDEGKLLRYHDSIFVSRGYAMSEVTICVVEPPSDPGFCFDLYEPVCGCDEVTYSNACFASEAGVSTWTEGVCETADAIYATVELPDAAAAQADIGYAINASNADTSWRLYDVEDNLIKEGTGTETGVLTVVSGKVEGAYRLSYSRAVDTDTIDLTIDVTFAHTGHTVNTSRLQSEAVKAGYADYLSVHTIEGSVCDYVHIDLACAERADYDLSTLPLCSEVGCAP